MQTLGPLAVVAECPGFSAETDGVSDGESFCEHIERGGLIDGADDACAPPACPGDPLLAWATCVHTVVPCPAGAARWTLCNPALVLARSHDCQITGAEWRCWRQAHGHTLRRMCQEAHARLALHTPLCCVARACKAAHFRGVCLVCLRRSATMLPALVRSARHAIKGHGCAVKRSETTHVHVQVVPKSLCSVLTGAPCVYFLASEAIPSTKS